MREFDPAMLNIPLIVLGSIATFLGLGCICHHECKRRKDGLASDGHCLSNAKTNELHQQYWERQNTPAETREVHDSWPIRNPASMCVRVTVPPDRKRPNIRDIEF